MLSLRWVALGVASEPLWGYLYSLSVSPIPRLWALAACWIVMNLCVTEDRGCLNGLVHAHAGIFEMGFENENNLRLIFFRNNLHTYYRTWKHILNDTHLADACACPPVMTHTYTLTDKTQSGSKVRHHVQKTRPDEFLNASALDPKHILCVYKRPKRIEKATI